MIPSYPSFFRGSFLFGAAFLLTLAGMAGDLSAQIRFGGRVEAGPTGVVRARADVVVGGRREAVPVARHRQPIGVGRRAPGPRSRPVGRIERHQHGTVVVRERVWVPGRVERIWVPAEYGFRILPCGSRVRFVVRPGHYRTIEHPGHYEWVTRRVPAPRARRIVGPVVRCN
jgi:hypothetical protein